jgi:DNA repair photolyase
MALPEAIYQPKGLAFEYSPLACNLYRGCSHGCTYCYCPSVLRMQKEEFFVQGAPRKGILEAVVRDSQKFKGDPRPVLLSFTSDPYQPAEAKHELTKRTIEIMARHDLKIRVLTKNPVLAVDRDLDLLLKAKVQLGTTLVFSTSEDCAKREPGAPSSIQRMNALQLAKSKGLTTWVSFEPVIKPVETLGMLEIAGRFADIVKIGRWNYDKDSNEIPWGEFLNVALSILKNTGLKYYIKNDLWNMAYDSTKAIFHQTNIEDGYQGRVAEQRFH